MKYWIILLSIAASLPVHSQKKVVPVTFSEIAGITLPEGSKQDARGLIVASARVLLEYESKKNNSTIGETEVLVLPAKNKSGFTLDSLFAKLHNAGWQINPLEYDNKYAWLKKENLQVLSYFSFNKNSTDVYFGKAYASSDITSTEINSQYDEKSDVLHLNERFTFSITNWDDGWISIIDEDKVVVKKNQIKVFIYFPLQYDDKARSSGRDYFWDHFIARQFRVLSKQYRDGGEVMAAFQPPYIEGSAIDSKSGEACFLGFYITSDAGFMYPTLVIAPDESSLHRQFPNAADKYHSDIPGMRNYNKFAIGKKDLTGTWTGGTSAAMNYYNAYSGNYLGMNAVVGSDEFHFNTDDTYSSVHKGASGMVGSMKTYQQKFEGKLLVSNWQISLSNRQNGATKVYYAYFEAVKGGSILHLQDKEASAMWYHLVKK
jgi:hypothetical protein